MLYCTVSCTPSVPIHSLFQLKGLPDGSPITYGFTKEMCAKIAEREGVGLFYALDWAIFQSVCWEFPYGVGKGQDAGEVYS